MKNTSRVVAGAFALALTAGTIGAAFAEDAQTSQEIYKRTNQKFLEDTVSQIDLVGVIKSSIPKSSLLALRNMETEGTTDKKIIALVEDQLISQLVGAGYQVAERDDNAIRRALEERSAGSSYSLIRTDLSKPQDATKDISISEYSPNTKNSTITVDRIKLEDNTSHMVRTHLQGADFIISYRIQELGINYSESMFDAKNDVSDRAAIARLHVRVESAVTGKIVKSENIEAYQVDEVSRELFGTLARYKFSQFHNGYPTNNSNEDRIYRYDNRQVYIEYAVIGSQNTADKFQVGIKSGPHRLGIEKVSLTKKEDAPNVDINLDTTLLVFGKDMGTISSSDWGNIDIIGELGIGEAKMNDDEGEANDENIGVKAGIGLEGALGWGFSAKAGLDLYATDAGAIENIYLSVLYSR